MLIALTPEGQRTQATRHLPRGQYQCPDCGDTVIAKPGRTVTPHFAHAPESACESAGESIRHLTAKQVLGRELSARGYETHFEVAHPEAGRRVDLVVSRPESPRAPKLAVEIQDSAIAVEEAKRRVSADRKLGYVGTLWVFTAHRAKAVLAAGLEQREVRVPDEMRWVDNRFGQGVHVIDASEPCLWHLSFSEVLRGGESYYTPDGDECASALYTPKTIREVSAVRAEFLLRSVPGRFEKWSFVFCESEGVLNAG